jgi:hypothetical protein
MPSKQHGNFSAVPTDCAVPLVSAVSTGALADSTRDRDTVHLWRTCPGQRTAGPLATWRVGNAETRRSHEPIFPGRAVWRPLP